MEQIKVIQSSDSNDFQEQVNDLLKQGWILYGMPTYQLVSCQDSWGERQRAWTRQSFVQVLKLTNNEQ